MQHTRKVLRPHRRQFSGAQHGCHHRVIDYAGGRWVPHDGQKPRRLQENLPLPGISQAAGGAVPPTGSVIPLDIDKRSEGNAVAAGTLVTISPVQGVPVASLRCDARPG
jgi:hypothetical protein